MKRDLILCAAILSLITASAAVPHFNVGDYYAQVGLLKLGGFTYGNDLGFMSHLNVVLGQRSQSPLRHSLGYPKGISFKDSNRGPSFPVGNQIGSMFGKFASTKSDSIVLSVLTRAPFRIEH